MRYIYLITALFAFQLSFAQLSVTEIELEITSENGDTLTVSASEVDDMFVPDTTIVLQESTVYDFTITLYNGDQEVTDQLINASDVYQFFFEDSLEVISGSVDYMDMDVNGFPVGQKSRLTSNCTEDGDINGSLSIVLNELVKSEGSSIQDGTTILDASWNVTVVDDPDAPGCENEEEIIDRVTLTFVPTDGGDTITAIASDPDGPGPLDLVVEDVTLQESTDYELSITLENTIEGEDITEEIMEEDEDHLFLFAFGETLFANPEGDGNIDNRLDPVNYNDLDENMLPVGLSTNWTTACTEEGDQTGSFRVVLKHQPGEKSATSGIDVGGTDVDITWNITVVDDPDAPGCENEEEIIDRVTLTFVPTDGGDTIIAIASDPDGPGPLDLVVEDVTLQESTDYELSITLENTIEGEDITEEIKEEDEDHLFLFAFGETLFANPEGDGNIDNRLDPVNYNDLDENMLPVGLSTNWTTACTEEGDQTGSFRVVLKHQPGEKSATSGIDVGGTDVDITWNVTVVDYPDAPGCENEEEVIDRVTLTFVPTDGGDTIIAIASDPDGPGPLDLVVEDVNLAGNITYEMSITVENTIEGEDITAEIAEEAEEHQFFFAWTEGVFEDPMGNGNVDNPFDTVNYNDMDSNGLTLGLSTNWTTSLSGTGTLTTILKHQPDIKSSTSSVEDGGTDIDIAWNINVGTTSADNLSAEQSLVIAPNPVRNGFTVIAENLSLSDARIRIFNSTGLLIKEENLQGQRVTMHDLPAGHYILSIQNENWYAVRKIVVIK